MTQAVSVREAELRALIDAATDEDLTDGGRYFGESCNDLTRCRHEEIGEYQHSADGELIEWLWNNRRGILAALATPVPSPSLPGDRGWQPIESAPDLNAADEGDDLLLLFEPHDMGGFIFVGTRNADGQWYNNLDLKEQRPSHWMPLPTAPESAS